MNEDYEESSKMYKFLENIYLKCHQRNSSEHPEQLDRDLDYRKLRDILETNLKYFNVSDSPDDYSKKIIDYTSEIINCIVNMSDYSPMFCLKFQKADGVQVLVSLMKVY